MVSTVKTYNYFLNKKVNIEQPGGGSVTANHGHILTKSNIINLGCYNCIKHYYYFIAIHSTLFTQKHSLGMCMCIYFIFVRLCVHSYVCNIFIHLTGQHSRDLWLINTGSFGQAKTLYNQYNQVLNSSGNWN